ncbi:MAG TPA: class I SAM-dependent methyltransferase [Mycobacteriales bacterium]|nr:class I SAM-dependent methyltransferase [Mycobacteriales bacterium]
MSVVPNDYDCDPDRVGSAVGGALARKYPRGDVHPGVAQRLASEGCHRVLDVGGGTGTLARLLTELGVVAVIVDQSPAQLRHAPAPKIRADGHRLPFRDSCVDGVAMLWTLYHFIQPGDAVAEAWRVLRSGGVFVACAPSRWNDPELADYIPGFGEASVFDAEVAPGLVSAVFGNSDVEAWDGPLLTLQDEDDLARFLRSQLCPPERIPVALREVALPSH